jgi:hypothetical protein
MFVGGVRTALAAVFALVVIGSAACGSVQDAEGILIEAGDGAEISFVSLTDMKDWMEDAPDLRWGIAMSRKDITTVRERDGRRFSEPAFDLGSMGDYVLTGGIETGEVLEMKIRPGTYDWLILMDHENDGVWDSYLGSVEEDIKLDGMQFAAGQRYEVVVGEDAVPRLRR